MHKKKEEKKKMVHKKTKTASHGLKHSKEALKEAHKHMETNKH